MHRLLLDSCYVPALWYRQGPTIYSIPETYVPVSSHPSPHPLTHYVHESTNDAMSSDDSASDVAATIIAFTSTYVSSLFISPSEALLTDSRWLTGTSAIAFRSQHAVSHLRHPGCMYPTAT